MISVCIPIHNYDVLPLAESIVAQDAEVELVCIDDGSTTEFIEHNRPIEKMGKYIVLGENVGRARVRNRFLDHAQGDWLLFLDNDSLVPENFLKAYRDYMSDAVDVIVGGRIYDNRGDNPEHRLRHLYGTRVESQPAAVRRRNPYRSFMTNNFMVRRRVMEQIGFDSRLSQYGHEDTLFGYRLEQQHVPILHIDNAVVNGYVESNEEFLQKTVEGVGSLVQIYGFMKEDAAFCRSVRLLRAYNVVRVWHLQGLVRSLFQYRQKRMEASFLSGNDYSLRQFNFYKLGTFVTELSKGSN
jgi:GT2 family glycosyltransferase